MLRFAHICFLSKFVGWYPDTIFFLEYFSRLFSIHVPTSDEIASLLLSHCIIHIYLRCLVTWLLDYLYSCSPTWLLFIYRCFITIWVVSLTWRFTWIFLYLNILYALSHHAYLFCVYFLIRSLDISLGFWLWLDWMYDTSFGETGPWVILQG